MKKNDRHKTILVLMIISQMLLTAFVLYWLQSQYSAEKRRLQRELAYMAVEARNDITDSILYGTGNTSADHGNRLSKGHSGNDSVKLSRKKEASDLRRPPVQSPDTIFIPVISRVARDMMQPGKNRTMADNDNDTVHNADSHVRNRWFMSLDTASFRQIFNSKLSNSGMAFSLHWSTDGHENNSTPKESIATPAAGPVLLINKIAITGFRKHIISNIIPQIFFGLVLVLLTALAFFFSYRSINEHIILSNLKNEFIGNITHELKTPVATLSVAIESLTRYNLKSEPGKLEEYLQLASVETKRLEELINRVLDNTVLQNGGQQLNMIVTDINGLIKEVTDRMLQTCNGGSITFTHSEKPMSVMVDPLFFKGAIINLIDNSIKYCDKDPLINVISYTKGNYAVTEINDNGPGIPEEYLSRVFEKFFRLPSGNVHNVKGYGLGLSYVSQIIGLHHGSVEVHNLNPGCSFIIKLPLNHAEKQGSLH